MKNVLVIGSLNMDYTIYVDSFPKAGETLIGESRFVQPGGKGANQAAAVGKSGLANCTFVGAKGNDSDGSYITEVLKSLNINCVLKDSKESTGNATIIVDKTSENKIIIISGANADLHPEDIDPMLLENADFVILQNEIPAETNEYVMKLCNELGKTLIYNPAPFRKIDPSLFKYVTYFIPNEIELSQYSMSNDLNVGMSKMLDMGVKNLLVTLGSKGSIFSNGAETIKIDAFKTNAIDTVAAGDTFVGYFVSALASGKDVREAIIIASKASSITVSKKGSIVSIPFGNEIR